MARSNAGDTDYRGALRERNADLDELDAIAEKNPGLVRNPNPKVELRGGQEHDVQFDDKTGRVNKFSRNGIGLSGSSESGEGGLLPSNLKQYQERVALFNEHFPGADWRIEGIRKEPGGVTGIATSMRKLAGKDLPDSAESKAAIAKFMHGMGFTEKLDDTTFYNPTAKVLVADAKPNNFKRDAKGRIAPVDLVLNRHEPDSHVLKAWRKK
jgi:hypothetical protein